MKFSGKTILITGAASGIGADAAIHFSKLGALLAIVDRNEAGLNAVRQKITVSSPLKIVADVTTDAERIINTTVEHFGQLDVLVNCAGIVEESGIEDLKIDSYDRLMNTNVRSVLLLTQLAIKHLEKTKGNIVNISSKTGIVPSPPIVAYAMSKAVIAHFTRCVALDLAEKGIRVNAISPAVVATPIFGTVGITDDMRAEYLAEKASHYPLGRVGDVSDTSKAIAFLASDDSSFITGQCLVLDGGHSLTSA